MLLVIIIFDDVTQAFNSLQAKGTRVQLFAVVFIFNH